MPASGEVSSKIARFLESLPPERKAMMRTLRRTILESLPNGYVERFEHGVFSYEIPLSTYPNTYNGRPLVLAALASQKSYVTLYLMAVYGDKSTEAWFKETYAMSGKKLNMGKSCVHFKTETDIPLGVVRQAIARVAVEGYLKIYEAARRGNRQK